MIFVYHRKPEPIEGSVLHSLTNLKTLHPKIYQIEVAKYRGREALLSARIPILNCFWNDVLHFSPIDPRRIYAALVEAGAINLPRRSWYRVPVQLINGAAAVYFRNSEREEDDYNFPESDFAFFDVARYQEITILPSRTTDYIKSEIRAARSPLFYKYLPHVLMKGQLDVSSLDTIEWT